MRKRSSIELQGSWSRSFVRRMAIVSECAQGRLAGRRRRGTTRRTTNGMTRALKAFVQLTCTCTCTDSGQNKFS